MTIIPGRIGWQKSAKDRPKKMQLYNDVITDQTIFEILDGIRIISKFLIDDFQPSQKFLSKFFSNERVFFFYAQVSERKFLFVAAAVVATCVLFFFFIDGSRSFVETFSELFGSVDASECSVR